MLNFIYYPVSAILWFWHEVFGFLLGPTNGFGWALAVIFLVFTLRTLLIKPFIGQVRSMRKMQEFQPQIKKLQEKYKGDKTKLAEEMQKLQKEHGVNPLGGCLPVLVQLPVFIGLFHVLRGFQPSYAYNYVFDRADIQSFLDSNILGVRLSESIAGGSSALGHFSLSSAEFAPHVIPVALPLMIIASVATHFTARVSQAHQSPAAAASPQAAMMGRLTLWLFPIGVLVFGAFFPVAILLYWLSNNSWTLTQQYLVYKKIDREEQEAKAQAREQRDHLAPRPGQKPVRAKADGAEGTPDSPIADSPTDDEPRDTVSTDLVDAPSGGSGSNGSGARPPGKNGSGQKTPGKVAGNGNGNGKSGKGSGSKAPGKVNGNGKSANGKGGGNGQLASSGQGKRSKKRR